MDFEISDMVGYSKISVAHHKWMSYELYYSFQEG